VEGRHSFTTWLGALRNAFHLQSEDRLPSEFLPLFHPGSLLPESESIVSPFQGTSTVPHLEVVSAGPPVTMPILTQDLLF